MSRDGWELPTLSAPIATLDFLQNVRKKVVYCPRTTDIPATKRCFSKPTKSHLLEQFNSALEKKFSAG